MLSRLRTGDESFLDLGCCVGQDLRKLVFDGCPSDKLYGADLRSDFFGVGYELFLDRDKLNSRFLQADVFDPASSLSQLDGKIDIIYAGSFFHLFEWDDQVRVARRLVAVLRAQPGSLILGRQAGNLKPGSFASATTPTRTVYRHDVTSFRNMWEQVGQETGTSWRVEGSMEDAEGWRAPTIQARIESNEQAASTGHASTKRMRFAVWRQ